jgi:hypothetical protein
VHVFAGGRILESGGPEVATRLEHEGYAAFEEVDGYDGDADDESASATPPMTEDPFADPFA